MARITVFAMLISVAILAAGPAMACRGQFSEQYLIWYDLPDLLPGEIAVEIDAKDVAETLGQDNRNDAFKVKRVLAGAFEGATISYRPNGSSCARFAAGGASDRLILVGRLERSADGSPVLIPRYMPYTHPIREEAERKAAEIEDARQ